jgi:cellulose synthase/poly-beta-1,6-N-acetylglucosamine synthase-like glycosyltransferase
MNINRPLSCIGNNMSYRKSVYNEVGGYENIPFSVTEDFKLLMTIFALKKYKIIYPLDPDALVESRPCENFKAVYWQKKRWGVGGLDSALNGFTVMTIGFVCNLMILLLPFFYSTAILYLAVFKIMTDFFFLYPVLKKLNLSKKLKYFLAFEIYFIFYVILLPILVLVSKKVVWKERKY